MSTGIAIAGSDTLSQSDQSDEAISTFRAAIDTWQTAVSFASSFNYRETYAASMELALGGKYDDGLGPEAGIVKASGVFHKSARLVRYRFDYGGSPIDVDPRFIVTKPGVTTPTRMLSRLSYDQATNGILYANYYVPHAKSEPLNRIDFRELATSPLSQPRPFDAGINAADAIHPLNPMGNRKGHPLFLWDLGDAGRGEEITIQTQDNDRVEVHLSRMNVEYPQERRVVIFMQPNPPVVERVVERNLDAAGKVMRERTVVLSNFVECPGGLVARKLVAVTSVGGNFVRVAEWLSDDLGNRPPGQDDFIVRVRPDTFVDGLNLVPALKNGIREFDMSKLSTQSLRSKNDPIVRFEGPGIKTREFPLRWLLIGNVVAILMIVVAVRYARKRKRH